MDLQKMGKFIALMRKKKGLTQSQLGEQLGLSGKAISKWERGISAPDISLLNDLSRILEASISEILTGEKIENSENNINTETANKIALSGIGAYSQIFKKKYTKLILILIITIVLIIVFFSTTYLITNYNKCFVYKLSSGSDKFHLEGLIASNQKENSVLITGITYIDPYIGTIDELKVKSLMMVLKIGSYQSQQMHYDYENNNINDSLKDFYISINENSKLSEYIYNEKDLKNITLNIECISSNDEKINFVIPISIEKKFSNNKLIY